LTIASTGLITLIETDTLVVGAGPIGLFQVFQLGLQGLHAHVIDALAVPGGQCIELYPDKPIYDIPGLPVCTGRELTDRLLAQVKPFKPTFHFQQLVESVSRHSDGRWLVATATGPQFLTRTLFIAAGVGAFVPKELKVDGLAAFSGQQLFYRHAPAAACADKHVVVVGGEDEAVANAIALTQGEHRAQSVTLLYRRDFLQASDAQLALFESLKRQGAVRFLAGQVTAIDAREGTLTSLTVCTPEDDVVSLLTDTVLVCQGVSPKLGPISQWGLAMARKQLVVDSGTFATNESGIFAVGDVVTYPGKKKLIVCGFHEVTLAAFAANALIHPDASNVLHYTTSSALLQQRLGIHQP